jgi:hypothetical protein
MSDMEERDAHLYAELGKRRRAILCLDWTIEPPRHPSAAEKAQAEWLTEVLTDAADPFEELLVALLDGVGHGFAPVELEWLKNGTELLPAFHPRPQEWFRLDPSRRELRLRDASAEGAPLQPFGWILHTYGKAKTGYPRPPGPAPGAGLAVPLQGLRDRRLRRVPRNLRAAADYRQILRRRQRRRKGQPARRRHRPGARRARHHAAEMSLEIQSVTGSGQGSPHLSMVDWAERSQSKAILGQTMSAESRSSGLGSGNAELHDEVRRDILKADARQVEGTLTRDLLYPLLALNRGGIDRLARCPRIVFDTSEAEDLASYAESLPKLVAAGLKKIPTSWVHEKLRIPEAADGEETLGSAAPAAGDGGPRPPGQPPVAAASENDPARPFRPRPPARRPRRWPRWPRRRAPKPNRTRSKISPNKWATRGGRRWTACSRRSTRSPAKSARSRRFATACPR